MDNNLSQSQNPNPVNPPIAVNTNIPPLQPTQAPKSNNKLIISGLLVVLLFVLVGAGSFLYLGNNSKSAVQKYNPTSNQPATVKSAPTAVPTQAQADIQSKEATDTQLDMDMQSVDNSLSSLSSDSKAIDTSILDQETNLQ